MQSLQDFVSFIYSLSALQTAPGRDGMAGRADGDWSQLQNLKNESVV